MLPIGKFTARISCSNESTQTNWAGNGSLRFADILRVRARFLQLVSMKKFAQAILSIIFCIVGSGFLIKAIAEESSVPMHSSEKICAVLILSNPIREAGSYYGIGSDSVYLLEMQKTGYGPILLRRKFNAPDGELSQVYLTSKSTADCQTMTINLDLVKKTGPYAFNLKKSIPPQSVQLEARTVHGVPQEGEFRKLDLRVTLSSMENPDSSREEFTLYRTRRHLYEFGDFERMYKKGNIDQMVAELCVLMEGATSEEKKREDCMSRAKGDADRW